MDAENSLLPTIDVENENQIEYASHHHPLTLCEIDDTNCSICRERCLGRRTYGCNECGLFLHESCTKIEIPQEIDHYFHPHPLRLALKESQRLDCRCQACRDSLPGLMFECHDCGFYMDVECALLPTKLKQDGCIDHIQHFIHPHPLILCEIDQDCSMCGERCLGGRTYGCNECYLFLHESCTKIEIPREIDHYFHPHPLGLAMNGSENPLYCHACNNVSPRLMFQCWDCDEFCMDFKCALLPTRLKQDGCIDHIQHFIHPHPLILCEIDQDCSICGERCFGGRAYGCYQCDLFLHESCAKIEIPQKIDHYFHPHPLKLAANERSYPEYCHACNNVSPRFMFECRDCEFCMDVECALLPTKLKQDGCTIDHRQHFKHPHPLILCDYEKKYEKKFCRGCKGGLSRRPPCFSYDTSLLSEGSESVYGCAHKRCEFFLHEDCALLPPKIDSPFHPRHQSLSLTWCYDDIECQGCKRFPVRPYTYQCPGMCNLSFRHGSCKFVFCVECAFSRAPVLKLESHKNLLCKMCDKKCDSSSCFKCIDCIYNPLLHCGPLPRSIEDTYLHHHPLTLMDDFVGDGIVHCDVCKQPIDPGEFGYHCKDCNFIAELKCVEFKVLSSLYGVRGNVTLETLNATRIQVLELDIEEYLVLFPSVNSDLCCVVCNKTCDSSHIFRCIEREYNLHLQCGPLPCSINDKCHIGPNGDPHPLKLMYASVEDGYVDDTVYCDACEQPRDPDECVYYCKDCNFIAELKCVEHEVLSSLYGVRGNVKLRTANKTRNRVRAKLINNVNVIRDNLETDSDNETEDMGAKYLEVEEEEEEDDEDFLPACYTDEECEQLIEIFKKARVQLHPSTSLLQELFLIHQETYKPLCAHIVRYKKAELQSKGMQGSKISIFCYSSDEESDNDSRKHLSDPSITGLLSDDFKQLMKKLDSYYEDDELLKVFFHRDYQIVRIGEHKIKPHLASVLKPLLNKYGDFTAKSKLSERLKAKFLTMFCQVIHSMCRTNAREVEVEVLHKWWKALQLAQLAGFEIEFAIDQLYKIVQVFFGRQAISLYDKMKSQAVKLSSEVEEEAEKLEAMKREFEAKKTELKELKLRVHEHKCGIEFESSPILKKCLKHVSEFKWKKVWDGSLFR